MRSSIFAFVTAAMCLASTVGCGEPLSDEATAESDLYASQTKVAGSLPLSGERVDVSYVNVSGVIYVAYSVDVPAPMRLVAHGRQLTGSAKPVLFLTDEHFANMSKSVEVNGEARIECQLRAAGRYYIAVRSDSYQAGKFQVWIDPLVDEDVPCHGVCGPDGGDPKPPAGGPSGSVSLSGTCTLREYYKSWYCLGTSCHCNDRTSTTPLGTVPVKVTLERVGGQTQITIPALTLPQNKVLSSTPGATFLLSGGTPEQQTGGGGNFTASLYQSRLTVRIWKNVGAVPEKYVKSSSADCGYGGDDLQCEFTSP